MATKQSDVQLVIRARDEASKSVAQVQAALQALSGAQGAAGRSGADLSATIADVSATMAALERTSAALGKSYDTASTATGRLAAKIHATTTDIEGQRSRVDTLTRGLGILRAEADAAFVGPRRDGLKETIKSTSAELRDAERAVARLTTSFDKQTAQFSAQRSSLSEMRGALNEIAAGQDLARKAIDETTAAMSRQQATMQAAAAASARSGAAQSFFNAKFAPAVQNGPATSAGATFDALRGVDAAAEREEAADAARLRAALDPLGAIRERQNVQLERYRELARLGVIKANELAAAETHLAAEAQRAADALKRQHTGGRPELTLLGLAPYETQNLLYQVNDVVSSLASGQGLARTLAQQGGQIFQIFQGRVGPAIKDALTNPAVLAGIVSFGALALALKESADQAERLREFQGALAANADGGLYDATKLATTAHGLQVLGASAADASKTVEDFVAAGINPARLDEFARAAENVATVTGDKLPDAAKKLTDAFTGGYDAVARLDDATNFLTAAQREHIKALFDEGDAQQGRAEAFRIFAAEQDAAAEKQRGPWSDAVRALGGAWKDFLGYLGDRKPIEEARDGLAGLAGAAADVLDKLSSVRRAADVRQEIQGVQALITSLNQDKAASGGTLGSADEARLASYQARLASLRGELAKATARPATSGADTIAPGSEAQRKADDKLKVAEEDLTVAAIKRGDAEKAVTTEKEKQARLDKAARDARAQAAQTAPGASSAEADRYVAQAVANERAAIAKEDAQTLAQIAAERERQISTFLGRVVGAEGGTAKNPHSSAAGFGQFTESTYLEFFRKAYGDTGQSRDQILATRYQDTIAKGVLDAFTRSNADALEKFGAKVTAGNLYLAHFLGAAGAKAVLQAPSGKPVDQVIRASDPRHASQVLDGNRGYLFDQKAGRYRTAGELQTFIAGRVGDTGAAQSAGVAAIVQLQAEGEKRQREFDEADARLAANSEQTIKSLTAENGLRGEALLQVQRQAAVEQAILDLRERAASINRNLKPGEAPVTVSDAQIAQTRSLAGAKFDVENAHQTIAAHLETVDQPVSDLSSLRGAVQGQISALQGSGQFDVAEKLKPQLETVTAALQAAIDKAREFYAAFDGQSDAQVFAATGKTRAEIDAIKVGLDTAKTSAVDFGSYMGVNLLDATHKFSDGAVGALQTFLQEAAAGKNVFRSLESAFLSFASQFLIQIATMIEQQIAFNLVSGLLRSLGFATGSGGAGGATSGFGAIGGVQAHTGAVIGHSGGEPRMISPAALAVATRYHTGGIAGLAPDEVPAILRRNEEVLTAADPRHRFNGGAAPAQPANTTILNVFDPADALEKALRTPAGEKIMINHVQDNATAYRAVLN